MRSFDFLVNADPGAGFREGAKGSHTSRTIMLEELERVLRAGLSGQALREAVDQSNLLEKSTSSGRAITLQRLRELYGLDMSIPLFRVLRLLWTRDGRSLPLLALLAALARDPLLRASAKPIVALDEGAELSRSAMANALRQSVGARLNEATLEKVVRNVASSFAQSGHLTGRTFKKREKAEATPGAMAFAVWLAQAAGFMGEDILSSAWIAVLDLRPADRRAMLERARAAGLVDVRQLGSGVEIDAIRLTNLASAT